MKRLVRKAQKGNSKAFLRLFEQFEADMYRMAFVYVRNQEDALDIVQEVAYQSFKKIDTLKEPDYLKTWLIRITINCSLNLIRNKQKVIQLKPNDERFFQGEEKDFSLSITLQELLNLLEENEKSIVLLRYYQEYTFREIAELLDMPLGTVKTILYRALNKLRVNMKEAGNNE